MKKFVSALFLSAIGSLGAQAQTLIFVEIPNVPGESLFSDFEDTIEATTWSQTVANVGGPPVVMPLRFEHRIDKATPKLIEAALLNTNLGTALLSVTRLSGPGGPQAFLELSLDDTRVAAVEAINTAGEFPTEQVTLTCSTFSLSYRPQNPNGTLGNPITVQGSCQ